MKDKEYKKEDPRYNWVQACSILKISHLNRIVVEVKHGSRILTEEGWKKLLKEDGIKMNE